MRSSRIGDTGDVGDIEQWELQHGDEHVTDLLPVMPADVTGGHHITSTMPGAGPFRSQLVVSRFVEDGHVAGHSPARTIRRPGQRTLHEELRHREPGRRRRGRPRHAGWDTSTAQTLGERLRERAAARRRTVRSRFQQAGYVATLNLSATPRRPTPPRARDRPRPGSPRRHGSSVGPSGRRTTSVPASVSTSWSTWSPPKVVESTRRSRGSTSRRSAIRVIVKACGCPSTMHCISLACAAGRMPRDLP